MNGMLSPVENGGAFRGKMAARGIVKDGLWASLEFGSAAGRGELEPESADQVPLRRRLASWRR